jgi:dihydroorotate dehydrogenase electron transfer subunit
MKQGLFSITENTPLTPRAARLRLRGDTSGITAPGQFVNLEIPGFFLRRPFSVCDWDETSLTLLYETVGKGTAQLRELPLGTELDVLTGLGNGFDLRVAGPTPLLVGGGSGLSPLYGLAKRLLEAGSEPRVILGFRSREDMFFLRSFHALGLYPSITTEDGSFGIRGFVTEAMTLPHSSLYACGPEAMLRAVSEKSEAPAQLSFDVRMGCGFGACMGCTKQTVHGPRRVCKDGPVFRKEEILWGD